MLAEYKLLIKLDKEISVLNNDTICLFLFDCFFKVGRVILIILIQIQNNYFVLGVLYHHIHHRSK